MLTNTYIRVGSAPLEMIKKFFIDRGVDVSGYSFDCIYDNHCYGVDNNGVFGCVSYDAIPPIYILAYDDNLGIFYLNNEAKKESKSYYYLIADNGSKPNFKHESIESARNEAERLLLSNRPPNSIEIVHCIEIVKIQKKVVSESLN